MLSGELYTIRGDGIPKEMGGGDGARFCLIDRLATGLLGGAGVGGGAVAGTGGCGGRGGQTVEEAG